MKKWGKVTYRGDGITDRACQRKMRHKTEDRARVAAQSSLRLDGSTVERLWVYPCPCCRGWHLTKQMTLEPVAVTRSELREGAII